MYSLATTEGKKVTVQDGFEWLKAGYAEADKTQKRKTGSYQSAVYIIPVPESVDLTFKVFTSKRVINPGTGRVAGSESKPQGFETLTVPAGTDVRVYGDPRRIAPGSSVATFYIGNEQVTYKRDRNLVRRNP